MQSHGLGADSFGVVSAATLVQVMLGLVGVGGIGIMVVTIKVLSGGFEVRPARAGHGQGHGRVPVSS